MWFTLLGIFPPILLLIGIRKYLGFSFFNSWISSLGESQAKSKWFFNLALIIFFTQELILSFNILTPARYVIFISFILSLIVIICPMDTKGKAHGTSASALTISILLTMLISIVYGNVNTYRTLSLAVFILGLMFYIFSLVKYKRHKNITGDAWEKARVKETNILVRNVTLLEWVFALFLWLWVQVSFLI